MSISWASSSSGMARNAGPGRPVVAARNAARISSGTRSARAISAEYLVIGLAMSTRSVACQAPPRSGWVVALRRVQAMATTGCPSPWALVRPASMLAPPGPGLPITTVGRCPMRAWASAMWVAASSWWVLR